MADLTKVFIFGVILPTIITVLLFVVFLVCWYKCDIRERFLKKCFKKKFGNSQKSSTSVTYIKDTSLTLHGSRPGSRTTRNTSGDSSQYCQASQCSNRANHANLGFVHEDTLPKPLDGHISTRYPPLYGPFSPYDGAVCGVSTSPSNGVIGKTEVMLGSAMDPHVPPHSDSGTYSMAESHNSITDPSRDDVTTHTSARMRHDTHESRTTPEARTPRNTPTTHSDIQTQQEYCFQPARSCSRDVTRKTSQPNAMDNSSSSYSSSDGDINESDYGHFVPTAKDKGRKISDGHLKYTPGYAHVHTYQPANSNHAINSQGHNGHASHQGHGEQSSHNQFHSDIIRNSHVTGSRSRVHEGHSRNPISPQQSASLTPDSIQLDIKDFLKNDCYHSNNKDSTRNNMDSTQCIDLGGVHFIHNSAANLEAHI